MKMNRNPIEIGLYGKDQKYDFNMLSPSSYFILQSRKSISSWRSSLALFLEDLANIGLHVNSQLVVNGGISIHSSTLNIKLGTRHWFHH